MMLQIIVVEDDLDLREAMRVALSHAGMTVEVASDGASLTQVLEQVTPDVIVLDVNLPGESGFEIAARLRREHDCGIIMLTARGRTADKVAGLSIGADIYLVKPVDMEELEAVIRSLRRRVRPKETSIAKQVEAWRFDSEQWTLTSPSGHMMLLTPAEYRLLQCFAARPRRPVSREEILKNLGKFPEAINDRTLDTAISRLRRKVSEAGSEDLPIRSARSHGYVFAGPIEATPARP